MDNLQRKKEEVRGMPLTHLDTFRGRKHHFPNLSAKATFARDQKTNLHRAQYGMNINGRGSQHLDISG